MSLVTILKSSEPHLHVGFNSPHDSFCYVPISSYSHWWKPALLTRICMYLEIRGLMPLGASFVECGNRWINSSPVDPQVNSSKMHQYTFYKFPCKTKPQLPTEVTSKLAFPSSLTLLIPSLLLLGIAPQLDYLDTSPHIRLCFWGEPKRRRTVKPVHI